MMSALIVLLIQAATLLPGEEPVKPYAMSNSNAGASPTTDKDLFGAFEGKVGIERMVGGFVTRLTADPRIADTFKGHDMTRLRRTLGEQFCHLLGGGCSYTGRTMRDAHKDMGLQNADMNALVENLQAEMRAKKVPFWAQNRFLAKLAPMRRNVVER